MKRLIKILLSLMLVFALSGCRDNKVVDDEVRVFIYHNNGSPLNEILVIDDPNTILTPPVVEERVGYDFVGWFEDATLTIEHNFDKPVGNKSVALFAKWEPKSYTITFNLNGGNWLASQVVPTSYKSGDLVVFPRPRMTGYTFKNWYLYEWTGPGSTKVGDNGHNSNTSLPPGDLVLHAHWDPKQTSVSFEVNFPTSGGPSKPRSIIATYGQPLTLPTLPNTGGYLFDGWNTKADGSGEWYYSTDSYEVERNTLRLYAIWR